MEGKPLREPARPHPPETVKGPESKARPFPLGPLGGGPSSCGRVRVNRAAQILYRDAAAGEDGRHASTGEGGGSARIAARPAAPAGSTMGQRRSAATAIARMMSASEKAATTVS